MNFSVYTLKCNDGKYYVGSTPTHMVNTRFLNHKCGRGSKFCFHHTPIQIVDSIDNLTSPQAFQLETQVVLRILEREKDLDAARGEINYALDTPTALRWVNE